MFKASLPDFLSILNFILGCFLDDKMHSLLGLKDNSFQVLYHFTVGRGYVDSRILTKPACTSLSSSIGIPSGLFR